MSTTLSAPPGIAHVSVVLPETVVASEDIAARHGFDLGFLTDKLGIRERRHAAAEETTADLATEATRRLLAETGLDPAALDLLIVVTQTPDYCLPHVSALVHGRLDLPPRVAAFDINLGCSGFVYGLSAARAMMQAEGFDTAILVTAETYSKIMDPGDRATAPLFGDGAAATLLTRTPLYLPGRFTFGSKGGDHQSLIARGTGSAPGPRESLFMDGRGIFNFVMQVMPGEIAACLERNALATDDIDLWVFHQASRFMLDTLRGRLGLPEDKVVVDLGDCGNTTSSTVPIALARHVLTVDNKPKRVFISGFGVGLSWASTVLTLRQQESETP